MADFNPPTTSLFATSNDAASAVLSVAYDAGLGYSMTRTDAGASSTDRICFRGKAVPASTWEAIAVFKSSAISTADTVYGGITLYDSVSGKLIIFGIATVTTAANLAAYYYTNNSTFNAAILSTTIIGPHPTYFKIGDDGTHYTFSVSFDDGISWVQFTQILKASYFTATHIGMSVNTFGVVHVPAPVKNVTFYKDPDFT